jgi:hypothetical protein
LYDGHYTACDATSTFIQIFASAKTLPAKGGLPKKGSINESRNVADLIFT